MTRENGHIKRMMANITVWNGQELMEKITILILAPM